MLCVMYDFAGWRGNQLRCWHRVLLCASFLLSSVPLRNSTTRRAVFLFHGIHAPTHVVLHIEVPTNLARFWRAAPRQQSRIVVGTLVGRLFVAGSSNCFCFLGYCLSNIFRPRVERPFGVGSSIRMKLPPQGGSGLMSYLRVGEHK